ncbi:MAG: TonB-dependent receptor, partial [Acidobacteria bacterium]|nr:TonB-dependent receptor [Acidobacteriota bacterium]
RTNSVTNTRNLVRNHIWGGTLGNAVIKNKLFMFTSYEGWRKNDPKDTQRTLPTDLERQGDFSQSRNISGGLRTIYDPWTTRLDPARNEASRTPFAGNIIPRSRIDPTSARIMQDVWKPNGPGLDITGVNNFRIGYAWPIRHWNFSERVDWSINDNLKVFGRYSRVRTDLDQTEYVSSPAVTNDNGGLMNNRNIAGDVVWTMNNTTVWNFRGSFASLEDDYSAPKSAVGEKGLDQFWPGNAWYKPYIGEMPLVYYPFVQVGGGSFGKGSYWYQHPRNHTYEASVRKSIGTHNLKLGAQTRRHRADGIFPYLMLFRFYKDTTAATYISPDLKVSGDDWASFLLGAIDSRSQASTWPFQRIAVNFWGAFVQDDWKISRNITLNLGLRYEYEGGPVDSENRISRAMDVDNPIPEMQQNPPNIPAEARALMNVPYKFNGAWVYADENHRAMYDANKLVFMPRAGIAIRLNDKSALRFGYAKYVTPPLVTSNTISRVPMYGFNQTTNVAPQLQGVPGGRLSDPFPSTNPLILPVGKKYGRYTNLGDNPDWIEGDFRSAVNDRFNFSFQRELPNRIHFDGTYFINLGHDLPYTLDLNMVDPQLSYTNKTALDKLVPNPFYQYGTPETFPGQLRNRQKVTVGSLLKPYPQYLGLRQNQTAGFKNRYHAIQLRAQRSFAAGYSFLVAYNFNRERNTTFFNRDDQYIGEQTYLDSNNPRHRLSIAGTYDLPFGKGRQFGSNMHPLLNAILGGWSTSHIMWYNSGPFIRFGQMIVEGEPHIDNPDRNRWFNTAAFRKAEPFTPRTNPYQYGGITGPRYWQIDSTLKKAFPVREGMNLEFMLEAYNLTNYFQPNMPNTSVTSSLFGRSTTQQNRGREMQYSIRLIF